VDIERFARGLDRQHAAFVSLPLVGVAAGGHEQMRDGDESKRHARPDGEHERELYYQIKGLVDQERTSFVSMPPGN